MTGSNGFRRSALFIMCAGASAPGTFTTGSERVPTGSDKVHLKESLLWPGPRPHLPRVPDGYRTGSNGFRQNAFERKSTGAQAPATFTTGSERPPADSEKKTRIGQHSTAPNESPGETKCRRRKQTHTQAKKKYILFKQHGPK